MNLQTIREYFTRKGIEFRESNGELITKCVFNRCDEDSKSNEAHLYCDEKTGQYDCKKCGEKGNLVTFAKFLGDKLSDFKIKQLQPRKKLIVTKPSTRQSSIVNEDQIQKLHEVLPAEILKYLIEERLLALEIIKKAKIGYGEFYGESKIVIPIPNGNNGYFLKLRKLPQDKSPGTRYIMHPKGAKHVLYGTEQILLDKPDQVVIVEGELDCLLLESLGVYAVTGTGGANTFKESWLEPLKSMRRVYVCCDNDDAGKKGADRIIKLLKKHLPSAEIYKITIPKIDGAKDVTDFFRLVDYQPQKNRLDAFFDLAQVIPNEDGVSVHAPTQTPRVALIKEPLSLEDVFQKTRAIGLTYNYLVELVIAVYISTYLDKEKNPVWILVVGNPSSNKTTLVFLLRYAPDCYRLDTMTANPFSSGQKETDKPKDLLPLIHDRCFVVKDYSTLFGRNEEVVRQFVTDLVAIYDGEYTKHSPTRGTIRYESRFSHIGCITPLALHKRQQYMNMVGARFLQVNIARLSDEERSDGLKMLWSHDEFASLEEAAAIAVSSFCVQLKGRLPSLLLAKESEEIIKKLNGLADLTAHARGIVMTEARTFKDDEGNSKTHYETTDTQIEEPFRALFQLRKLCRALAVVRGKSEVTLEEVKTVRWIALSSMPCRRAEVLQTFEKQTVQTAKEVAEKLGKDWRTTKRHLDELCSLGVLDSKKDENDKSREYFPVDKFRDIICDQIFNIQTDK
jgi:5S rRNA maturation endonuclease (ribonuclease M5)